jgi:hypothetical protein
MDEQHTHGVPDITIGPRRHESVPLVDRHESCVRTRHTWSHTRTPQKNQHPHAITPELNSTAVRRATCMPSQPLFVHPTRPHLTNSLRGAHASTSVGSQQESRLEFRAAESRAAAAVLPKIPSQCCWRMHQRSPPAHTCAAASRPHPCHGCAIRTRRGSAK